MRILSIVLFFSISLVAKSLYLSNLPLPKTYIINIDTYQCDNNCLKDALSNGLIFTFLAHYNDLQNLDDENITNQYILAKREFNLVDKQSNIEVKIALLVPKKIIGSYVISTTNSILAYLLNKNVDFTFEVFDSGDEESESLAQKLNEIRENGYKFVIAPLTTKGAKNIISLCQDLQLYIPTVNKSEIENSGNNILFGGIDYKKQIERLMQFVNDKIAIFSDDSPIGYKLSSYVENFSDNIVFQKVIPQKLTKFKYFLKDNKKLNQASIFLNTPLVKTSLLASQFRFYNLEPYALFSTQISYNPLLFTLTQYEDRKNFFIADSIGETNKQIVSLNKLLDNNIQYNWINYSTSIGVDYIYTLYFNSESPRLFQENILNSQVQYNINIVKPTLSGFKIVDEVEIEE